MSRLSEDADRQSKPTILHHPAQVDFDRPGKHHYRLAFHLDSGWGYSLVPLTVINGLRPSTTGSTPPGVAAFGGTHGNEWEGQVAVKRLCQQLDPEEISGRVILMPQLSQSACAANQRISPIDHVNMNRAFPGNPRGTVSLRIADFVKSYVFPKSSHHHRCARKLLRRLFGTALSALSALSLPHVGAGVRCMEQTLFGTDYPFTTVDASLDGMRKLNDFVTGTSLPRLDMSKMEKMFQQDTLSLLGISG